MEQFRKSLFSIDGQHHFEGWTKDENWSDGDNKFVVPYFEKDIAEIIGDLKSFGNVKMSMSSCGEFFVLQEGDDLPHVHEVCVSASIRIWPIGQCVWKWKEKSEKKGSEE